MKSAGPAPGGWETMHTRIESGPVEPITPTLVANFPPDTEPWETMPLGFKPLHLEVFLYAAIDTMALRMINVEFKRLGLERSKKTKTQVIW